MIIKRRRSKKIQITPAVAIGGGDPIIVQSMANIKTSYVGRVVKQINCLAAAGCGLVRVSILDKKDSQALSQIIKGSPIPICADIHFNYQFALQALESGVHKIRLNPGNVQKEQELKDVIASARERGVPIRIGANSGSIDARVKSGTLGSRLASSILNYVSFFEKNKFSKLVLSAKAHTACDTIEAYRILAEKTNYPLHIGLTSSGTGRYAVIKSATTLGGLLLDGIGDTMRVSLADDPLDEVQVGVDILTSLGLRKRPWEVIACPTCGRTKIDVIGLAKSVEAVLNKSKIRVPRAPYLSLIHI